MTPTPLPPPVAIPLLTPTPLSSDLGLMPLDLSAMSTDALAANIAMETVGLWNQGIGDLWGYVSALLLVVLVIMALASVMKHLDRME